MSQTEPRALWIWLHRYIGLVSCLFLGFAAVTGCVLCFVRPLDAAINADLFKAPAVARGIDIPAAVDLFQARHPELYVRSFPLAVPLDRTIPVKVEAVDKRHPVDFDQVFLDRADGHLIGTRSAEPAWTLRGAMELLHDAHYTLLGGDWAKWFMGGLALAWLLSNLIGAYLTLPLRTPFWKNWRHMWRFSFKSMVPRMLLDMHRSSGLWLLLPMTALAFTSVALNFFVIFYAPAMGAIVPASPSVFDGKPAYPHGVAGKIGFTRTLELAAAERARTGEPWTPATALYVPKRRLYGVSLTEGGTLNYKWLGPITLYVDGDSGRMTGVESPYGGNTGLALIRFLYPVHSGRTAGAIGVAIVFVLGVVTTGQCVTGVYVWWKKRRSRVATRQALRKRAAARP
jgi:uncharacterized iron-regulated membrane protein